MAEISKPSNLSVTWASGGDILDPGTSKYTTGWQVEIPPRQWFNFLDNRQDEAIAHINQHGVAVWDAGTEYQTDKSYTQSPTTGIIYRCILTHTNQNPDTDLSNTYWVIAFSEASDTYTKAEVDAKTTISSTLQAQGLSDNSTLITPLRLKEAFQGANQSLITSGYQKLPGGFILQWGSVTGAATGTSGATAATWPITFPNGCLAAWAIDAVSFPGSGLATCGVGEVTGAGANVYWRVDAGTSTGIGSLFFFAIGH